jgi:hypothetical protein
MAHPDAERLTFSAFAVASMPFDRERLGRSTLNGSDECTARLTAAVSRDHRTWSCETVAERA